MRPFLPLPHSLRSTSQDTFGIRHDNEPFPARMPRDTRDSNKPHALAHLSYIALSDDVRVALANSSRHYRKHACAVFKNTPTDCPEQGVAMKNIPPSDEDLETLGEAYKELLEKALRKARQTGTLLHHAISDLRSDVTAMGKIGENEVVQVEQYLKRDLTNAAQYLGKTGKELTDWLGFDATLVEQAFWRMFSDGANKTTAELLKIKIQADAAGYHTGELAGLGTLVCDHCGKTLHFHKPGHIPPCPNCTGTHFRRQSFD